VNVRSPMQWEIVSKVIDFQDLEVADLGCGYCDLLLNIQAAGASVAHGVEHDPDIAQEARSRCEGTGITIFEADLVAWLRECQVYDVLICFSVLPYLPDMESALALLYQKGRQVLIECQYRGDGPGSILGDSHMQWRLLRYWDSVRKIGTTLVEIRNCERSIWLCEDFFSTERRIV